jgi:demethylmenaquinone methyltransferase/2-methoxy-6-polyprenyl-1,4-benzoquinol methylase
MASATMSSKRMRNGQPTLLGAAPEGAADQHSAARAVREMFTLIAPRYDLLNHLLSLNVDRIWWRRTARTFHHILTQPGARVLDLCCGTGDMTFALKRRAGKSTPQILGVDFSHTMLQLAAAKSEKQAAEKFIMGISGAKAHIEKKGSIAVLKALRHPKPTISAAWKAAPGEPVPSWIEADALNLPFPDEHFDLVTSAFGFRNLADYDAGLREIARLLRPGGECGILDFGEPKGAIGALYSIYFRQVLPRIGTLISGVRGPYAYLPVSVERFPDPQEMLARMKRAGFSEASWTPYTFGIAGLYCGKK